MRKLFFLILALTTTTCLWAYDFQSGDLCYNITGNSTVEVTIGDYSNLTTVTIPETVTCYEGTIYSVTSIGKWAFYRSPSLTSITIPNSITSIGNYAFFQCSSLTSITIPNSVTSIGDYAFDRCTSLASITISNSVTSIGEGTFSACSSLISIAIPNSITRIGNHAFDCCSSLTSITIPESVTSIGQYAFQYCSSLVSITIPESVTSIERWAFCYCSSLNSITIPNSVESIGVGAFSDCTSLTSVTIPNSVKSIGSWLVSYCISLTSIVVESGNTTYDSYDNCNAIIETATNTLIAGCQNTIIPNNVTSIGIGAFEGCHSLSFVLIPQSVTNIRDGAFSDCTLLTSLICEATEVPTLSNSVFDGMPLAAATLYVPAQSLDDYKAAEQWKDFGTILPIEELPTGIKNTNNSSPANPTPKLLRNGQLYVLKDAKTYTITGQEL